MEAFDGRSLALTLCLIAGASAAILTARTPAPLPPDAPAALFSAGRAMVDDRVIAARPHPEGSAPAKASRDYIFARMQALGLAPRRVVGEAIESFAKFSGRFAVGGGVENLIGVLPGTDPKAPALLLMAHSDSVPGSPGAADDAAGVVTALETIRALEAIGPHRRNVAVLITDGEEAGLLGARAFFTGRDPLLKSVGVVVNMESRGGGGRVAMFETGAHNGAAIRLFAHAVNNTDALSLMSQIYKYLPNSTDFTVAKQAGYSGYNFAFLGEQFDYHSPSSTPSVLDQGSVQHLGDQALALTRALADAPTLPPLAPDAVYADVLGGPVIAYSAATGWAVLGLAAALAVFGVVWGARRSGERLSLGGVARGFGLTLLSLTAGMLALHVAGRLIGWGDDLVQGRKLLAQSDGLYAGMALLGIGAALALWGAASIGGRRWAVAGAALAVGLLGGAFGLDAFALALGVVTAALAAAVLGRPLGGWSGWLGCGLLGLLLTLALQVLSPALTVASIWPVLVGAIAMAATALCGGRLDGRCAWVVAAVAGTAATVQLGHLATPVFVAVGPTTPEALAIVPLLATFTLYPLLSAPGLSGVRSGAVAAMALGVVVLAVVALRDPASARTPRPVQAFYLDDAATGQTWRASALTHLDPWSRRALGGPAHRGALAPVFDAVWLSPAPSVPLSRPQFSQTSAPSPGGRAVTVRITPHGGREVRLYLQSSLPLGDVTLNGLETKLSPRPGQWVQLRWEAPTASLVLGFTAAADGALDLRYEAVADGWPSGILAPLKSPDVMPWGLSDDTVLVDRFSARW